MTTPLPFDLVLPVTVPPVSVTTFGPFQRTDPEGLMAYQIRILRRAFDDLSMGLRSMFGLDGASPDLVSGLLEENEKVSTRTRQRHSTPAPRFRIKTGRTSTGKILYLDRNSPLARRAADRVSPPSSHGRRAPRNHREALE